MDLYGPMFLLLTSLVVTIYCLPDGLSLPDPSVFFMKPPKEFIDLFQPDDSKNLTNPMKYLLSNKNSSHHISDLPKSLPDPSVFEMMPPKAFSDLFRLKEKENIDARKDSENLVNAKKESLNITSVPDQREPIMVNIKPSKESLDSGNRDTENLSRPLKEISGIMSDKKYIPDPKVFEMKPPKEFLDLFQFRGKEKLDNQRDNIVSPIKIPSGDMIPTLSDEKSMQDQSVFEMKPAKDYINLFQFKLKEESDKSKKDFSGAAVSSHSLTDEKKTLSNQNTFVIKPPQEFSNFFHFQNKKESNEPLKWPSWSFKIDNDGEKINFPNWFYFPRLKPGENTKIDKQTEQNVSQKPQDVNWNQQTFESHSFYHQSPQGESTNKNSDAIFIPKDDILVKKDITEVKPAEIQSNEKVSIGDKLKDKQSQKSPPKISVLDNSIVVPVQLMPNPQTPHYGLGNMLFMSTLYPSQNYGFTMPSEGYGFEYTNQPNNQIYLSRYSSEVKPLALSGNLNDEPKSVHDILPTQNIEPNDVIISSIKHSNKENDPSGSHVAAMILPSKTVPQTRNVISGNNMVINNGDKLANVDQIINGTPAPNAYNYPSNEESNQENFVPVPEMNLDQGNIPNSPPLSGQSVNYPVFGSNGNMLSQNNYPYNQKPETANQGNIQFNPPNLGQPVSYSPFVSNSNNMIGQNSMYPQNQQPVLVNVPYGSNQVPLNYVLVNGAPLNGQMTNTQNSQLNSGQGVMVPSPMVGGYNQNSLYALVPISKPKPYLNTNLNGNGYHQVTEQVFNLVPAQNNMLLTTKDEDDL